MAKHYDQNKERDESQQQGNGRVPPGTLISRKEPEGEHSAPEEDDDEE